MCSKCMNMEGKYTKVLPLLHPIVGSRTVTFDEQTEQCKHQHAFLFILEDLDTRNFQGLKI